MSIYYEFECLFFFLRMDPTYGLHLGPFMSVVGATRIRDIKFPIFFSPCPSQLKTLSDFLKINK